MGTLPQVPFTSFHPSVAAWFTERIGQPSPTQIEGWPAIASGDDVLVAAPTGTGKTLTAFLGAIDRLMRVGPYLEPTCRVLYVSPLRALANDIAINVLRPIEELQARDPFLPAIRVLVRTGDTTAAARQAMTKKGPHILATTPESLSILLTSASGRAMLGTVDTVIIDEIHAVAGSKRGAHLSLSLERLDDLRAHAGNSRPQRIGLSATQKPLDRIAAFLTGSGRSARIVDIGHLRHTDCDIILPQSPLSAVCSNEVWGELYQQMVAHIRAHRTTLIFVNTRKLAERLSQRLIASLNDDGEDGEAAISCHHGSLSKERRLQAEQRLKAGSLRALVATATLELGIDIGEVNLVLQVGSPRAIATFLQRLGRAGHRMGQIPKARLIPLTNAELVESCALLHAMRNGELDAIRIPETPMDVLAQQIVAFCVDRDRTIPELHAIVTRAYPYRQLDREMVAQVVAMHAKGRFALLHYDPATGIIRANKRARLTVITCSGAIPDTAQFQVREDPDDVVIGTLDEDFSLESNAGDIFQLGNTSWQVIRVESRAGIVRVRNAYGAAPTIPFWIGEAPGRTPELSQAVGRWHALASTTTVSEELATAAAIHADVAQRCADYLTHCTTMLGQLPTDTRIVAERFFDDTGSQHVAIHSCFGTRINRAWGLALRKRFCTGFGFELEAAATDEGLLLSLAPTTSFALADVFTYLSPTTLRATLVQACITGGQFETRWRWASTIALLVERSRAGTKTPPHLLRIRANDQLIAAFPGARTCPDNLPPGAIPVPEDHPIVAQTVRDCLHDLMDIDGLTEVITGIRSGRISTHAVETAEPSPLAQHLIAARPYAFLDDTPAEERRTRAIAPPSPEAVMPIPPTGLTQAEADELRALAWPDPQSVEELHDVLTWIGWMTDGEIQAWHPWFVELQDAQRIIHDDYGWHALGINRDSQEMWRGRLDAVAVVPDTVEHQAALIALEVEGLAARIAVDGQPYWIHRRWLHRHVRAQRTQRRAGIRPISLSAFLRFLTHWQHVEPSHTLAGHPGLIDVLTQLTALELPAAAWTAHVLPTRLEAFLPTWLDDVTVSGEFMWGRLWSAPADDADGGTRAAIRTTPIGLFPRAQAEAWLRIAGPAGDAGCSGPAREVLTILRQYGALFTADIFRLVRQVPAVIEDAIGELVANGLVSCDSAAGLRWLLLSPDRRRQARPPGGRWTLFRTPAPDTDAPASNKASALGEADAELVARTLLRRTGMVCRALYDRERIRVPWWQVLRQLRRLELQGHCVGGRFVSGTSGEQYALPEAATQMQLHQESAAAITLPACDPLNYTGILTPGPRVRPHLDHNIAI